MKRLFSRSNPKGDQSSKEPNSFIGKVFNVGRFTVTVEDIIAEGNIKHLCVCAFHISMFLNFASTIY